MRGPFTLVCSLMVAVGVFNACSGSDSNEHGASNGGGSGTEGGASGDSGGAAGASAAAGSGVDEGGASSGSCTKGEACSNSGHPGLCRGLTCGLCSDPDDDDACVTAYGKGHLCIAGSCLEADCRTEEDCGGDLCLDNICHGCESDADCADPTPVCNTDTGKCVDADQCSGVSSGDACPVNSADRCCDASGSKLCISGCCTAADCENEEECTNGICISTTCGPAPSDHHYYVDSKWAVNGNGSETCPFKTLGRALDQSQVDDENLSHTVTITLVHSIDVESEGDDKFFPHTLPPHVNIEGASIDTIVTVPKAGGAFTVKPGPNTLSSLTIATDGGDDPSPAILVNSGADATIKGDFSVAQFAHAVKVNGHLTLQSASGTVIDFRNNIFGVTVYGSADIAATDGGEINCSENEYGLWSTGAVDISTNGGRITFDDNETSGIDVQGAGSISLTGEGSDDPDVNSIRASRNGHWGMTFTASGAGAVSYVTFADDGGDDATHTYGGLHIIAGTAIKVDHCAFYQSSDRSGNKIAIDLEGAGSLAGISFGKTDAVKEGHNFLHHNGTGICIRKDGAGLIRTLNAKFNRWSTTDVGNDCSQTDPSWNVGQAADCASGTNLGLIDGSTKVDVSNCKCETTPSDTGKPSLCTP